MNINEIQISVVRETDDDCYVYTAQASKLGKSAFATGYTAQTAIDRAVKKLNDFFCLAETETHNWPGDGSGEESGIDNQSPVC